MSDSDDDDVVCAQTIFNAAAAAIDSAAADDDNKAIDHRKLPRKKRRVFDHAGALQCINRDYLGPDPLFGKEFPLQFRISRGRFQTMMEDVAATGNGYYLTLINARGEPCASFEARLLLPLKTLAYGVPPHAFCDYFQMSIQMARDCCTMFDKTMKHIYHKEYLRLPTAEDIKAIVKLHKSVHGITGMIGSLDCMHTYWKNCPKAWQGSYKNGKEKKPSIVLEAMSDHHLWFWHASYGYAGTLNDLNILNMSPLMDRMLDGSLDEVEKEAAVVPFKIGQHDAFNNVYILVDGIYPRYSRFVRAIKEPITAEERSFTKWQEAARKDIERAFGVMQNKFQWITRPIQLMKLPDISGRVTTCLILHNMSVADRVMEGHSYRTRYNLAESVMEEDVPLDDNPEDLVEVQQQHHVGHGASATGIGKVHPLVQAVVARKERFQRLGDQQEHARLHVAIMDYIHN